jgi:integrase
MYLNYLYLDLNRSERYINSHLTTLRTFWFWLIENGYIKNNIFTGIKKKKTKQKNRIFIDKETRQTIFDYFEEKNKNYLAICYLTFYGLLRPREITYLRKSDFDLDKNILTVRPEVSKTGKTRIITIPGRLKKILIEIGVNKLSDDVFIFSIGFIPGKKQIDSRYIGKEWAKMRKELQLPNNIQFYSLKDSGIIEMLRAGVSPEAVRDQAGHSSLEMTNKYVQIVRQSADEQILNKIKY